MNLLFDRNQTHFDDCIQEKIWELATRLLPLEVTLPYVPDALKAACAQWHEFNQNLFADMRDNPSRFGFEIDPAQPDYMNKKQVEFYHWLIGGFKELSGDAYVMAADAFKKHIKKFRPASVAALAQHGFVFSEQGGAVAMSNTLYPQLFVAVDAITRAGYDNYKVNRDSFMMHCDFRAFGKYKRTYLDLHTVFSDKRRMIAEKIHAHATTHKIMPQKCYYFFRADYKHKGTVVYTVNVKSKNRLFVNIGFANFSSPAFEAIQRKVEQFDDADAVKKFVVKHLAKCETCHADCRANKPTTEVFGKTVPICRTDLRFIDSEEADLKHIYRLLDIRAALIREDIADPYYPGSG